MPNTYYLLASNTVGSGGVATVTFSSIPSTYTDLLLKASARDTFAGANNGKILLKFNGSSTSDYSSRQLFGNGSSAGSSSNTSQTEIDITSDGAGDSAGNTANTFSNNEVYIPNYTSSDYKSFSIDAVAEENAAQAFSNLKAGLRSNTAAITSITLTARTLFAQHSTFYLYGIKNS
jgi:hypothetical protein